MTCGEHLRSLSDEKLAEKLAKYTMNVQRLVRRGRMFESEEWLCERLLERLQSEIEEE